MLIQQGFRVAPQQGRLHGATQCPSPNCDQRPEEPLTLVVIHNISLPPGRFGGGHIESFFCNQLDISADEYFEEIADLKVSAHLLIARTGRVTQFVPFNRRAWHAGVSHYRGRERCNDFSIGIELEGTDCQAYEEAQYEALAEVVAALMQAYPTLSAEHIVGHCDIAPKRKTDPGPAFNWSHFRGLLEGVLSSDE